MMTNEQWVAEIDRYKAQAKADAALVSALPKELLPRVMEEIFLEVYTEYRGVGLQEIIEKVKAELDQ